jgi:hypothetical protein
MPHEIEIPLFEDDSFRKRGFGTVCKCSEPKMSRDVWHTHRGVIGFLLFKGYSGDKIARPLKNLYGQDAYCRAIVFSSINGVHWGSEELRNERRPWKTYQSKIDAAIRLILQEDSNASLETVREALVMFHETAREYLSRIGHALKIVKGIPSTLTTELEQTRLIMCAQSRLKL